MLSPKAQAAEASFGDTEGGGVPSHPQDYGEGFAFADAKVPCSAHLSIASAPSHLVSVYQT